MALSFFETVPGVKLAYQLFVQSAHSARTPLVLVQGLSGVKEDWMDLVPALNRDRTVLIFDNRGIGQSTIPKDQWTISDFATDVLKLAQHVGFTSFHVFGISMGGMIAQWVALLAPPGVVRRVVLGCTSHGGPNAVPSPSRFIDTLSSAMTVTGPMTMEQKRAIVVESMLINLTDTYAHENPARFNYIVDQNLLHKRSARGIGMQVMALMKHNAEPRLHEIKNPTLIIHGHEDNTLSWENSILLTRKIAGSRLLIMPGVGHCFWLMDDGHSATVARKFFAEDDAIAKL